MTRSPSRPGLRRAAAVALAVLALMSIAIAAVAFWLGSESGLRFVLERGRSGLAGGGQVIDFSGPRGGLYRGVEFDAIRWTSGATTVQAQRVSARWSLAGLLRRRLVIDHLAVDALTVVTGPSDPASAPTTMPGSFASPLDITLNRLSVGELRIRAGGEPAPEDIVLADVSAAASYAEATWRIGSLAVTTPYGKVDRTHLSIGAEAPHPIDGRLEVSGRVDPIAFEATLVLAGDLERLRADIEGTAQQQAVTVTAQLAPLAVMPLLSANATTTGTDLAAFGRGLPATRIDATLAIRPPDPSTGTSTGNPAGTSSTPSSGAPSASAVAPTDFWRGEFSLRNHDAGPSGNERVPVESASGSLRVHAPGVTDRQRVIVEDLHLRTTGAGEIDGTIDVATGERITAAGMQLPSIQAALRLRSIDLSRLSPTMPRTALAGRIEVTRDRFVVDLTQDESTTRALLPKSVSDAAGPASVRARGTLDEHTVRLESAHIELGRTRLDARGRADLGPPHRADLRGDVAGFSPRQWLPASIADDPRLRDAVINGRWSVDGNLAPTVDARVLLDITDSRLAGETFVAALAARVSTGADGVAPRLRDTRVDIRLGRNRVRADGALGRADDTMTLRAQWPQPGLVQPGLSGTIDAEATLRGAIDAPAADIAVRTRRLTLTRPDGDLSIGRADLTATVPPLGERSGNTRLALDLAADAIRIGEQPLDVLRATVDGTSNSHRFTIAMSAGGRALKAAGRGRAELSNPDSPAWRATLDTARIDGPAVAELRAPATIAITTDRARIGDMRLALAGGEANLGELDLRWGDGVSFASRGTIDALSVVELMALAGTKDAIEALEPMRLSGRWRLAGSGLRDLGGRVEASLIERPVAGKPALGIEGGNAVSADLDRGRIDGRLSLDLPSLAFTHQLTAPEWVLDGRLKLSGTVAGTTERPEVDARLEGHELSVSQRALAWRLDDGELSARFNGRQVVLETLRFDSDDGRISGRGSASVVTRARGAGNRLPIDGRFTFEAERVLVPLGPGQRVLISGATSIDSDARQVALAGKLRVDRGIIELQGSNVPGLPDDIEVVGLRGADADRGKPARGARSAAKDDTRALRIASDVEIALGDDLKVTGKGVQGRITGALKVGGHLPEEPSITGAVRIVDAKYEAYGQNLVVERGEVRFNGPVDNPSLDIVAKRPLLPVDVGIAVTGTARTPTITLTSKPDMPDSDKLSWLVLGVAPTEAPNAAQWLALRQAAAQLLGGNDGPAKPGVADRLGLDVLNFGYGSNTDPAQRITENKAPTGLPGAGGTPGSGSASAAQREVVTVGKRLSDRLFVTYERGVRGLWNLLRIQYRLTQRLSVRGQSGSDTAVDLSYSYSFD